MSSIIRRRGTVAAAILTGLIAITTAARETQVVEAKRDDANAGVAATLKDQVDLAVTVYNSNIALVRDVRQIALPAGAFDLRFLDIAATVNPATVHFRSLTRALEARHPRAELPVRSARSAAPAQEICRA